MSLLKSSYWDLRNEALYTLFSNCIHSVYILKFLHHEVWRVFVCLSVVAVESELLHTYSSVDPLDTLILCVRLAVLVAVTLTVPVVLFPVRTLVWTHNCSHLKHQSSRKLFTKQFSSLFSNVTTLMKPPSLSPSLPRSAGLFSSCCSLRSPSTGPDTSALPSASSSSSTCSSSLCPTSETSSVS